MKRTDEVTRETYNRIAGSWASRFFDTSLMKRERMQFEKLCKNRSLILDAGCGAGRDTLCFIRDGYNVISIDYSKSMLKEAKKRVLAGHFRYMKMQHLKFKKNTFDGIWASASILHIKKSNAKAVLREFKRVLKKNGILFISVKSGKGEEIAIDSEGNRRFYAYYTKSEFLDFLKGSGFLILKSYVYKEKGRNIDWINTFSTYNDGK